MVEFFINCSVRKGFLTMTQNLEAIKAISVNINVNIDIFEYVNIFKFS